MYKVSEYSIYSPCTRCLNLMNPQFPDLNIMSGAGDELMMSAAEATWGMLILATIIIIGKLIINHLVKY